MPYLLTAAQARRLLVDHLGLRQRRPYAGPASALALLRELGCIQLDPLDRIGTNADLVGMARLEGLRRGALHADLLKTGEVFEHFAKERCILPADLFPAYREQAKLTPHLRHSARMKELDVKILEAVLEEVRERGAAIADELEDHGEAALGYGPGWSMTRRATALALEILWVRCQLAISARTTTGKRYDLAERVLGGWASAPVTRTIAEDILLARVASAGLLSTASGPCWGMLGEVRTSGLPEALEAAGELARVRVQGSRREYLTLPRLLEAREAEADDGAMRILGPLDPLLWDRKLVQQSFDFEYIWEVYKPVEQRRWGWYVCPLLLDGRLVGRFEGRVTEGRLEVEQLWQEDGFDLQAWDRAFELHRAAVV